MQDHVHGDWKTKELNELREGNATLRHALKAARERSASRLARLNKAEAAQKKDRPKNPVPAPLRLVAAE